MLVWHLEAGIGIRRSVGAALPGGTRDAGLRGRGGLLLRPRPRPAPSPLGADMSFCTDTSVHTSAELMLLARSYGMAPLVASLRPAAGCAMPATAPALPPPLVLPPAPARGDVFAGDPCWGELRAEDRSRGEAFRLPGALANVRMAGTSAVGLLAAAGALLCSGEARGDATQAPGKDPAECGLVACDTTGRIAIGRIRGLPPAASPSDLVLASLPAERAEAGDWGRCRRSGGPEWAR